MFRKFLPLVVTITLFIAPLLALIPTEAQALQNCNISVLPTAVLPSSTNNFSFEIGNPTNNTINWLRITRPSADFTLGSVTTGWNVDATSDTITLTGSSINSITSETVTVSVTAGSAEAASANWTVEASIAADGSDAVACSGGTGTEITNTLPEATLEISSIGVSSVNTTSVVINWTTNISATTELDYGETDQYGTTSTDETGTTSHTLTLNGLSADSTYHYKVRSISIGGQTVESEDNTFTTAAATTTTTTTVTTTTTKTVTVTVTVTQAPTPTPTPGSGQIVNVDRTPPVARITTDLSKPVATSPLVKGIASDNQSVKRVEYSTDDGQNWLPVDQTSQPSKSQVNFEFLPQLNEDGNYSLRVRVFDEGGLVGLSSPVVLVIDRLPPQVGANLVSVGPLALLPSSEGVLFALAGLDEKITVSAVGGPVTVDILAGNKVFSLVKNLETGLWSGALGFSKPGIYRLVARSTDGAKNTTTRKLNSIVVLKNGLVASGQSPQLQAEVTVYHYDAATADFAVWDGQPYGQTNPQKTLKDGRYRLLLPAGRYYLMIKKTGFKTLKTGIFELERSLPVNADFALEKSPGIDLGPLHLQFPDFFNINEVPVSLNVPQVPTEAKTVSNLTGKSLPTSSILVDGRPLNTSFLGQPTILSLLNTWSPLAISQLKVLEELAHQSGLNVLVVVPQQSVPSVEIFQRRGNYRVNFVADPDGELVKSTNLNSVPTHLFINRKGLIEDLKVGLFTKDELLKSLLE